VLDQIDDWFHNDFTIMLPRLAVPSGHKPPRTSIREDLDAYRKPSNSTPLIMVELNQRLGSDGPVHRAKAEIKGQQSLLLTQASRKLPLG